VAVLFSKPEKRESPGVAVGVTPTGVVVSGEFK
jgi:hypothetical protein